MKYAQVREKIYQCFVDGWNNFTEYVFDNEDYDPGDAGWVRVVVRGRDSYQSSLGVGGNRKFARKGVVFIQIFTPINGGTAQMGSVTEKILDVFEGKRIAGTSICFQAGMPREIGPEGVWYNSNVEIEFTYEEIK